ncbi:MAG: hypothetical protein SGPRY_001481 [Prymnesium sp.]
MASIEALPFAEDRAFELQAVSAVLGGGGGRERADRPARQASGLLRRRTGSAIPLRPRSRARLASDVRALLGGRSRRDRRRAAIMRARGLAVSGLETHMWHAKRFHMRASFGLSIPWRSFDRGEKAAVRAVKEGCTVHDASYTRCLRLRGRAGLLLSALEHTSELGLSLRERMRLGRELVCVLHRVDAWPAGAIGPVRLLLADATYT